MVGSSIDGSAFRRAFGLGDRRRPIVLFLFLMISALMPVWAVSYFFSADGPSHLHSAHLMLELAGSTRSGFYTLNPVLVPNSTGHWMLALLLLFFSPALASKIMVSVTYAGFVAGAVWLRYVVRGLENLNLSVLYAAVIGLNVIWLFGLYNFIIGTAISFVAIGSVLRWEGVVRGRRILALSFFFTVAFFSHLISFGVLAFAVFLLVLLLTRGTERAYSLAWTALAAVPVIPFAIRYQALSAADGGVAPSWQLAELPLSFSSVLMHLRTTDPFLIISRQYIPFYSGESSLNVLAAPILWIGLAILVVVIARTASGPIFDGLGKYRPHILVTLLVFLAALTVPDTFGSAQGSVLRPRLFVLAMGLMLPLLSFKGNAVARHVAATLLVLVFAYQTTALWEYAISYDRDNAQLLSAGKAIRDGERVVTLLVYDGPVRFNQPPVKRVDNLFGFGNDTVIWDNYETGYFFFPVVANRSEDREFIRDISGINFVSARTVGTNRDDFLKNLAYRIGSNNEKIDSLVLWGRDEHLESMLGQWFEATPYFENGNVRVFRHRLGSGSE